MSAHTSLPRPRRKPVTYGRLSQRNAPNYAADFDDSADGASNSMAGSRLSKRAVSSAHSTSPLTSVGKSNSVFDIPSSGDEKVSPQPRLRVRPYRQPTIDRPASNPRSGIFDVPISDDDDDCTPVPKPLCSTRRSISVNAKPKISMTALQPPLQEPQHINSSSTSAHSAKRRRVPTSPDFEPRNMKDCEDEKVLGQQRQIPRPKRSASQITNKDVPAQAEPTALNRMEMTAIHTPSRSTLSSPAALGTMINGKKYPVGSAKASMASVRRSRRPETLRDACNQATRPTTPRKIDKHMPPSSENARLVCTPTQARMWGSILNAEQNGSQTTAAPLSATTQRLPSTQLVFRQTQTQTKRRLIDTLGTSAEETSSSDEEQSEDHVITPSLLITIPKTEREVKSPPMPLVIATSRSQVKFTYGGQHSYLDESANFMENLSNSSGNSENPLTTADTTNLVPLENRINVRQIDLSDEGDEDGINAMRTIHELRASGDSIRFENDLFMEDFEVTGKPAVSRKRGALLQICQRLNDAEFRDRFTQCGLELRLMHSCRAETDCVIGTALATVMTYALALSSSFHSARQLYEAGVIELLVPLLEEDRDIVVIAKHRASNMSKVGQNLVTDFRSSVLNSPIWAGEHVRFFSPSVVALKCLDLLIQRLRLEKVQDAILTEELLTTLLRILRMAFNRSDNDKGPGGQPNMVHLKPVLSVLESLTVVESCALHASLWNANTLSQLVDELERVIDLPGKFTKDLLPLLLRMCLNLSNNVEKNTKPFSRRTFVAKLMSLTTAGLRSLQEQNTSDGIRDFDNLVLCLGTLFNLAEWSDSVRLVILHDCEVELDSLLTVFTKSRSQASEADSLAASSANVAYGYLAILIGHLCQNNDVRLYVQGRLPGMSLTSLSDAVEEFIAHHKEADKSQQNNDAWVAFTRRLTIVAESLKAM